MPSTSPTCFFFRDVVLFAFDVRFVFTAGVLFFATRILLSESPVLRHGREKITSSLAIHQRSSVTTTRRNPASR